MSTSATTSFPQGSAAKRAVVTNSCEFDILARRNNEREADERSDPPAAADSGPVLVTVEYDVQPEKKEGFLEAIRKYERIRRRDGAYQLSSVKAHQREVQHPFLRGRPLVTGRLI